MAKIKKGTYRFNDVLTDLEQNVGLNQHINFSAVFVNTDFGINSFVGCTRMTIDTSGLSFYYVEATPDLVVQGTTLPTNEWLAIYDDGVWITSDTTITIETDQEVSDEFATWFNANAKLQGGDAVTIEYNGNVIASFQCGTKAIRCNGAVMQGDVVVTVPEMGGGVVEEWDGSIEVV